jgi:hypothetical protein
MQLAYLNKERHAMTAIKGFLCVLLAFSCARLLAEEIAPGPQKSDGFVVHEWGVFTVYADEKFANAGRDAAWKELPEEVFGIAPGRKLPRHCVGADKPIIYFYNAASLPAARVGGQSDLRVQVPGIRKQGNLFVWDARKLNVRVNFPGGGAPMVWYPQTSEPMGEYWGMAKAGVEIPLTGVRGSPDHLTWEVMFPVTDQPLDLKVPNYAWKDAALKPESDAFSVDWYLQDCQKFLFYEGLLPNKNTVALRSGAAGAYLLSNTGEVEALDVFVIERSEKALRIAYVDKIPARADAVELKAQSVEKLESVSARLAECLAKNGGLFKPEAEGLTEIWRKEFFEQVGLHVLYRLPQAEYDRQLPLTLKPAAKKVVRVGLVWMPHLETDLAERIGKVVARLTSDDFQIREEATRELRAFGPAAIPHLRRLQKNVTDAEVADRLTRILNAQTTDPETHLQEWRRLQKQKRGE